MSSRQGVYDFTLLEKRWQQYWLEHKTFRSPDGDRSRPKYYKGLGGLTSSARPHGV